MLWVKAVAGKMKTDMQYSNTICYKTFSFPNISEKQKEEITELVFNILDNRKQLYDPYKMAEGLKEAHHQLDLAKERFEYLFKLYEEMIKAKEK